jgi:hypothetical protein
MRFRSARRPHVRQPIYGQSKVSAAASTVTLMHLAEAITISHSMTAGEFAVAIGTIILAIFAAASVVVGAASVRESRAIDELNARRAAYHRSRGVRGVARLVLSEIRAIQNNAQTAIKQASWPASLPMPHPAWDAAGAILMETLPEDEAQGLADLFERVRAWESLIAVARQQYPTLASYGLAANLPAVNITAEPLTQIEAFCRKYEPPVQRLAYPDARDVPSDPDQERVWRAAHRRRWWLLWRK